MHENIKKATVLGTHPVFGPGSNGVKHKAYILTPTNPEEEKSLQNNSRSGWNSKKHTFLLCLRKNMMS